MFSCPALILSTFFSWIEPKDLEVSLLPQGKWEMGGGVPAFPCTLFVPDNSLRGSKRIWSYFRQIILVQHKWSCRKGKWFYLKYKGIREIWWKKKNSMSSAPINYVEHFILFYFIFLVQMGTYIINRFFSFG